MQPATSKWNEAAILTHPEPRLVPTLGGFLDYSHFREDELRCTADACVRLFESSLADVDFVSNI